MFGIAIRIGIVACWLALSGWYIVRHTFPELGMSQQADAKAALAARLGKVQHYSILWKPQPTHAAEKVGTCSLAALNDDVGFRLETQLDLSNTRFLPGERMLRQAVGGTAKAGIRLRLDEMLDANLRLRAIEVAGSVFGQTFSAEGPVDHLGLRLTWKAAGTEGTRIIPEVRPERLSGSELSANLPAGLKSGDRFTTRISSLDPVRMRLATKDAVFTVTGSGMQRTAAGMAMLLDVEMMVDGRRFALLRCDDRGAVHRQELVDAGLILDLTRVTNQYGREIWPKPEAETRANTQSIEATEPGQEQR